MLSDRFQLRRQLKSAEQAAREGKPFDQSLNRFRVALGQSTERRTHRHSRLPVPKLNEDLPITSRREDIEAAIREHQVIIVCGETGSGKSTQLPLICLGMGRGVDGLIGHTQPRRLAARSVAARVADELGSSVGRDVGFKIRFTDATGPNTFVKLMTDGILLAESQNDRWFEQYDTIIIDEAHERSLNIDFLIGRIKQILPRRPDLKIIITSATIDAARFATHFGTEEHPAPVLEVAGRTYPVDVLYRPLLPDDSTTPALSDRISATATLFSGDDADDGVGHSEGVPSPRPSPVRPAPPKKQTGPSKRRDEPDIQTAILDAVDELDAYEPGDILIFMPTERDIHETAKSLRGRLAGEGRRGRRTEILPLYSRLTNADQNRIFQIQPHRRIVIATNVAESSLTVPGIRYVIDTGLARISRYSPRSRMQRLPVEPISQASADQRAGRCGRLGPGICVRLYSEADYLSRDRYTAPEIHRTNLASVILQTTALKLGRLEEFPFLEPPRSGTITDGYRVLYELGALDERNELTPIGRQLARLPVDPRVGRIILAGDTEDCLAEILIIASALELQDPRERPVDQQQAADEAHAKFQDENSDFLSYLKLWDFYHNVKSGVSRSKLRIVCQQNFLSYNRMREWIDIHQQLSELTVESGLQPKKRRENPDAIHRALLTGFISSIATLTDRNEYTAAGGQKVMLWPGSGLFASKPKWVVAAELVETSRRYVRTVARVQPEWIERLAGHLIKRTWSDPEWDGTAGSAMAYEKATLFGLPIVPRRRVRYSRINPEVSRELMIRHGLVEGDVQLDQPFMEHNQRLLDELHGLQTRTRRPDLVVDDEDRIAFYDQRIPSDVADTHALSAWLKKLDRDRKRILHMTRDDLRRTGTEDVTGQEYPGRINVQGLQLDLEYHLEPGSPEDGVTLAVPREALNQLDQRRLGWLVPGLVEEKVVALIKSLPKPLRRTFVPAVDTARDVIKQLTFGSGEFEEQVAACLTRMGSERICAADFQADRLPNHLRMNVRVIASDGTTLATGRDLSDLRRDLSGMASASFADVDDERWQQSGLLDWTFGDLPAQILVRRGNVAMKGYPAIIDDGESVSLRLHDMPLRAAQEMRSGLRRLAAIALKKSVRTQIAHLPRMNEWVMLSAAMGGAAVFQQNIADLVVDRAFFPDKGAFPRTEADYRAALNLARQMVPVAVQDVAGLLNLLMEDYARLRKVINAPRPDSLSAVVRDVKAQTAALTVPGFLTAVPWGWLKQYPRYFRAAGARLNKLAASSLSRDQQAMRAITACVEQYQARKTDHDQRQFVDPNLDYYRWMIEELRVSLFAQELGTAITVSEVRLEKQWEKVQP